MRVYIIWLLAMCSILLGSDSSTTQQKAMLFQRANLGHNICNYLEQNRFKDSIKAINQSFLPTFTEYHDIRFYTEQVSLLHLACAYGSKALAAYAITLGDTFYKTDIYGKTPIAYNGCRSKHGGLSQDTIEKLQKSLDGHFGRFHCSNSRQVKPCCCINNAVSLYSPVSYNQH